MRTRIIGLLGSALMVAGLVAASGAPVAAHHDDEFSFFDVYRSIDNAMSAKTAKGGKYQFNKGRAVGYNVRGWRIHEDGRLPRWIGRQCRSETRALIRDGMRYGAALKAFGRGKTTNWEYGPTNPWRARILAKSRVNSTFRTLEDTLEDWEDCIADLRRPRAFRI